MSLRMDRDPRVLEVVRELAPAGGDRWVQLEVVQQKCGHHQPTKTAINLKALVKAGWVEREEDYETGWSGYRAIAREGEPGSEMWRSDRPRGRRLM